MEGFLEGWVPRGSASLYARVIGQGRPIVVLHGGPDFDHRYLLPDLDELQDAFRLIYYDQRGRGRSAVNVRPEDVTLASEVADLDEVRRHFGLDPTVLLGHSWGASLALAYASRHPERVSHLILMNPAPASVADVALLREAYRKRLGADIERQREIVSSAPYEAGNPQTVAARYRIHFARALHRSENFERLMHAMEDAFTRQGSEGILKARAVEDRLMSETWDAAEWNPLAQLRRLPIPTLVITGDGDFIPGEVARNIAEAMPRARLVTITGCGHFAYLECAQDVRRAVLDFLRA